MHPLRPAIAPGQNQAFHLDGQSFMRGVKSITTITAMATAVLAAGILAYQNPSRWWLITTSTSLISLYSLPKILHYGNATMIRAALTINLITISSLLLGGMAVGSYSLSHSVLNNFKTHQFAPAFFQCFYVLTLIGYGMPFFYQGLQKGYEFINKPDWQQNFLHLKTQFHRLPEVGLGLLQCNLWQNFLLQLALFDPELLLKTYQILRHNIPESIWSMAGGTVKVKIADFQEMVNGMAQQAALIDAGHLLLTAKERAIQHQRLKFALSNLGDQDLLLAITILISDVPSLIHRIISQEQYLEFFQEERILNSTNQVIGQFLNLMETWNNLALQHQQLEQNIYQLFVEARTAIPQQRETLSQRHNQLNQEFNQLHASIEKIYIQQRKWKDFAQLWQLANHPLPFAQANPLLIILQNQALLTQIDTAFRSMMGIGQADGSNLADNLQFIGNKINQLNGGDLIPEDDGNTALIHLGANGFVQRDYEDLQMWFGAHSPHDLENKMAEIGLVKKEDLYAKGILLHQGARTKQEIRTKLQHYIENTPKQPLAPAAIEADVIEANGGNQAQTPLSRISEKVSIAVFRLINTGFILVPVLIYPHQALAGFAIGAPFFVLKRLGFPGTRWLSTFCNDVLLSSFYGRFIMGLYSRRIFILTPNQRENQNQFVNGSFLQRVRLIHYQLGISLIAAAVNLRSNTEGVGGFIQGLALAHEIVHLG